ncbi:calreticulin-like [Passer montanus]|uniref:calreticulin-like n=1 Tax=Passer montanus TaxID=9160 RepID=UPI00196209B4|nr:calreticulin-like [Passer montanus]
MSPLSLLAPALLGALLAAAGPTQFFREEFGDGDAWSSRWVESKHKPDYGRFVLTAGKFYGDAEKDKGIQTSQDARFYALSSRFEPFSNRDRTLVLQFTVKHEQNIDCGGGYVKLFPASLSQEDMHGDSEYNIMFGPDICGPGTKKVHVIFNYKGKNVLINKDIRCKDDEFTHLYTLVVRPDNTYEVKIDNARVESGSLEEDWDFLPPKKIKDPEAKKPEDWDERAKIDDPEDTKPEDWDKPEHIPDPEAKKPEDWDEEMDGEWEPPVIQNPEYKGEWRPQQIDNPNYKGKWVHPEIENPEYSPDPLLYAYDSFGVIGLDLWQVRGGPGAATLKPCSRDPGRGHRRDAWSSRWVESKHKPDYGRFVLTAGKFYGDAEKDKGIQTSQDARFYALSSRFEPFSNRDRTLVLQFTVKHEQNIDCA